MKLRLAAPEQVADLGAIQELTGIRKEGNNVTIGAMARHLDVAKNAEVKAAYPALAALAGGIGDRQVRALGTIGGSVANNDPAACYPSAVLASGATVVTDKREIAADDFFQGMFTTALDGGELIKAIRFPIPKRAVYEKLRQKASNFPLVGVFIAQYDSGVRVAVTGASNRRVPAHGPGSSPHQQPHGRCGQQGEDRRQRPQRDLHATAAYRANLISVLTQRGVNRLLGLA